MLRATEEVPKTGKNQQQWGCKTMVLIEGWNWNLLSLTHHDTATPHIKINPVWTKGKQVGNTREQKNLQYNMSLS
jgi:hypothetical protein